MVARPHGVRGAFKVQLHDPASEALEQPELLVVRRPTGELLVGLVFVGQCEGGAIFQLPGVESREAAEELRGATVHLPRSALVLEEGEYLYADLVGCAVKDRELGLDLGTVHEVFSAGAQDTLVVRRENEERLIPFVAPWLVEVKLTERTIWVSGGDQWEATPIS